MKYDTETKRIKFLKKGNIVTFKKMFYPRGTSEQGFWQIAITGIRKEKSGAIKLEGFGRDSDWFESKQELIDAIDWEIMGLWH